MNRSRDAHEAMSWLRTTDRGVSIAVRVSTRKHRQGIQSISEGTLKIWLHSPPVKNRANEELRKYLAEILSISPSRVTITHGHQSRDKVVELAGIDQDYLRAALNGVEKVV